MDKYAIAEEAYNNGYSNGYKDALNKFTWELKEEMWRLCFHEKDDISFPFSFIDKVAKNLLDNVESENNYGV